MPQCASCSVGAGVWGFSEAAAAAGAGLNKSTFLPRFRSFTRRLGEISWRAVVMKRMMGRHPGQTENFREIGERLCADETYQSGSARQLGGKDRQTDSSRSQRI